MGARGPSGLGSWRFLLSRRWILFALAIVVIGYGTWWLGEWQFGRLADRKESNAVVRANEHRDPVPVSEVLSPGGDVDDDDEWRAVTATGEYDVTNTVVVRYRTRDGAPGVDAVVPLVTADGTALLVDRGWMATDNSAIGPDELPDPPPGKVTVVGWVRTDGSGDSTRVTDHSTRAISSSAIADATGLTVYGGFVELRSEDPRAAEPLEPAEEPDLGNGPHFFYGLQWWFFGVLALAGFLYLAWDERRNGPRGERTRRDASRDKGTGTGTRKDSASEGAGHAAVDRQHHAGDEPRSG